MTSCRSSLPKQQPRTSLLLRRLRRGLIQDLEPELVLCERVAVLMAAGYKRADIARYTGASPPALRGAQLRLKRVAETLDASDAEV